ncbi:hypothetical protein FRACYDRAFT_235159 [Fragilariopsis cylindrus CCMP1102]|uniref:Glycosyltransferase family 92 protein n=1 Tax=Fragilariopsis cylindrus CCMP1102 TaxID=635003 RepID=A0A1E7FTT8_9STRA|nr:hypothetical protein FRACYDRAFT_235159 [Fragilariopsis cylindrus CCMP1102]|eukprot:OEU21534.1 hypothetical protein FRACYDRAFT_235159 [Fragilariopsis cylindrus CCMP1102]
MIIPTINDRRTNTKNVSIIRGEIYTRSDGKRVRRVKMVKSTASPGIPRITTTNNNNKFGSKKTFLMFVIGIMFVLNNKYLSSSSLFLNTIDVDVDNDGNGHDNENSPQIWKFRNNNTTITSMNHEVAYHYDDNNNNKEHDNKEEQESFSACLLWMDDNFRLEEWLAYHYYILKLRYVVINIDPNSKTSPMTIINRWNNNEYHHLNMTIVTMTDTDHFTSKEYQNEMKKIQKVKNNSTATAYAYGKVKTNHHRKRQGRFYRSCSNHLILQNKSWTSYHDVDEFITFKNPRSSTKKKHRTIKKKKKFQKKIQNELSKMKQSGYILNRLNEIKVLNDSSSSSSSNDTINNNYSNTNGGGNFSCVKIGRVRYNAKEFNSTTTTTTNDDDEEESKLPDFIDPKRFDTLRFKYISEHELWKSIIDLSQQGPREFTQDKKTHWMIHMPMHNLCRDEVKTRNIKTLLKVENIVINHYMGSWESYSFRDDARKGFDNYKTYENWLKKSNMTTRSDESSTIIWPWMKGFIDLVGVGAGMNNEDEINEIASYLLRDAGTFPSAYNTTTNDQDWNITTVLTD